MIDATLAQQWYKDKVAEFQSIVANTPENIQWQNDAHMVTSYSRDIKREEIVYKLTVVVRDHPIRTICTTPEDKTMYHYVLFALSSRITWQWLNFATEMYYGNVTAYDPEDELFSNEWELPDYSGYATVTVWGNVIDKAGRTTGLTLTDKSIMEDVPERMTFSNGLYDAITEMSGGVDMNADGNFAGYSTRIEKTKKPKSSYGKKKAVSNLSLPEDEMPVFETMDSVKALPDNTIFRVKIGKIATRNTGTESDPIYLTSFYGFGLNGSNQLVVDSRDGLYVYSNKIRDYKRVSDQTLAMGINIRTKENILETPIIVQAKKRVSDTKKTFYTDLSIVQQ